MSKQILYPKFNSRLIANLVDCFIVGMVVMPINGLYHKMFGEIISQQLILQLFEKHANLQKQTLAFIYAVINDPIMHNAFFVQGGLWRSLICAVLQIIIALGLLSCSWYYLQTSPGKILVGTRIVDANTYGKISFKQALIRVLVCAATTPFNIFSILTNSKRQAWHDKAAGTLVIKR